MRKWRRALHEYDPAGTAAPDGDENGENDDSELQPDEGLLADSSGMLFNALKA